MKLRTKLPLVVIPLIAVPLILVGLLAFFQLKKSAFEQRHLQINALLTQLDSHLQQLIDSATASATLFADDPLVQAYLLTEDLEERYSLMQRPLQRKLASIQKVYPSYYEMRLLLPDGYEDLRMTSTNLPNRTEEEAGNPLFQTLHSAVADTQVQLAFNPDNQQPALYVSRRIRLSNPAFESINTPPRLRAYLVLTISLESLLAQLNAFPWPDGGIFLSDDEGRLFHDPTLSAEQPAWLASYDLSQTIRQAESITTPRLEGRTYHHHSLHLHGNLWAHLLIPESVLLTDSRQVGLLVAGVCLAALAFSTPLLLTLIRRQFLHPVESLNRAISSLSEHQQLVQVPIQHDDELGTLSRSFNRMSRTLHQSSEQIRNLAFNDSLTGLPNRFMFHKTLARALESCRNERKQLALLFLDLDNFKQINDTLGHASGDELLVQVAELVQSHLRGGDHLSRPVSAGNARELARLGGDEFTILISHIDRDPELLASSIATRLLNVLAEPIRLRDNECYLGCSIGIALYPEDGSSADDLVKHADLAMYQAKREGKGGFQFFSAGIAKRSQERALVDQHLHRAVQAGGFHLNYQPIIDARTQQIVSLEALIRWRDPELGFVPPDQFIGLAEENGLIIPIGNWVLEEAARQQHSWKQAAVPTVRVAINVSSIQLNRPGLPQQMATLLHRNQLSCADLYIELTETALLQGQEQVLENLHGLRKLGIKIALDDFGTGYSSLSYLQNLPIDILKIDRSFINDLQENNNSVILSAIITMAHALGMQVVAEGVETQEQYAFLSAEGCDLMQGYLFSRPLPAPEIATQLSAGSTVSEAI